jgi:hypothetical protein
METGPGGSRTRLHGVPPAFVTKHDRPGGRGMPGQPPPRRRLRVTAVFHCSPDGIPPGPPAIPHRPAGSFGHGDERVREASFRHGRRRVSGTPRSWGGCTPARHSPWPGSNREDEGGRDNRRRSGAPRQRLPGLPAGSDGVPAAFLPAGTGCPVSRTPGPDPDGQSTIRSISSTQRSAPDPASAKAAIASNTASEKPPTLRMSARSCACVVA